MIGGGGHSGEENKGVAVSPPPMFGGQSPYRASKRSWVIPDRWRRKKRKGPDGRAHPALLYNCRVIVTDPGASAWDARWNRTSASCRPRPHPPDRYRCPERGATAGG